MQSSLPVTRLHAFPSGIWTRLGLRRGVSALKSLQFSFRCFVESVSVLLSSFGFWFLSGLPRLQGGVALCIGSCRRSVRTSHGAITLGLTWERNDVTYQENEDLFGCYALRTDRQDFESEELWRAYISLTQAEEGFRAVKTDLGLRPNYHQKEDRVDGHIFISILAFQLWKWVREKLDACGDQRDWTTVRRLLETHCYSTLIVPHADGSVHHLRQAGRAEAQQRVIYERLGIDTSKLFKSTRIMNHST